jgi:DNA-directed RNA polymerase specialized sigma24 family protein
MASDSAQGNRLSPDARQSIDRVLSRALVTIYLFTGNIERAEQAVLRGIESWNPDVEPEEALLQRVIAAAARLSGTNEQSDGRHSRLNLPGELQAVLSLAPPLRGCFVLRSLAGLPSQACAQLLGLLPDQVDEYTAAAFQGLGTFGRYHQ